MKLFADVMARLPKAKTAGDFARLIEELEAAHVAATADLARLIEGREAVLFSGAGDVAKHEAAVAEARARVETLTTALTGAQRRQGAAFEAEKMARLEALAEKAREADKALRAELKAFAAVATKLAEHAAEAKQLRDAIAAINAELVDGGRGDLRPPHVLRELAEQLDRNVADPVAGLVIPEFWPRHPDGPALDSLKA